MDILIFSYSQAMPEIDIKFDLDQPLQQLKKEEEVPVPETPPAQNQPKPMLPYSSMYIFSPVNPYVLQHYSEIVETIAQSGTGDQQ